MILSSQVSSLVGASTCHAQTCRLDTKPDRKLPAKATPAGQTWHTDAFRHEIGPADSDAMAGRARDGLRQVTQG